FAGDPLADDLVTDLRRLVDDGPSEALNGLLDAFECDALVARANALAEAGELPSDPSGRRVPWPLV
ncbi:MAG: phosphatidylinositol kinase, partial [Actinomycetota bacterium]|nr:phosphatidylinositol kinase [Actinomycetota bacterium]